MNLKNNPILWTRLIELENCMFLFCFEVVSAQSYEEWRRVFDILNTASENVSLGN